MYGEYIYIPIFHKVMSRKINKLSFFGEFHALSQSSWAMVSHNGITPTM
jgi:hypothetical protein